MEFPWVMVRLCNLGEVVADRHQLIISGVIAAKLVLFLQVCEQHLAILVILEGDHLPLGNHTRCHRGMFDGAGIGGEEKEEHKQDAVSYVTLLMIASTRGHRTFLLAFSGMAYMG
jgi:hypothetical protein